MVAKKTMDGEAAMMAGKETVEKVVKAGQEAAQKGYAEAIKMTKEQMDKAQKAMFTSYEEYTAVTKGGYDAYVAAMNVWTKAFEAMGKEVFALTQGTVEQGVETSKSLLACKTINEVVELQNGAAKAAFDKVMTGTQKLSEMSMASSSEAIKPLQAQWTETVERISRPLAA